MILAQQLGSAVFQFSHLASLSLASFYLSDLDPVSLHFADYLYADPGLIVHAARYHAARYGLWMTAFASG
jgi:hypothetical protein